MRLNPAGLDKSLSKEQFAVARLLLRDPHSAQAPKIVRVGWILGDVLAHGVIDYHPVIAGSGPAVEAADHMQDWFEAGAADGYWVSPDVYECGIAAFVEGVVPSCKHADSSTKITTAPPYVPISALELNTG